MDKEVVEEIENTTDRKRVDNTTTEGIWSWRKVRIFFTTGAIFDGEVDYYYPHLGVMLSKITDAVNVAVGTVPVFIPWSAIGMMIGVEEGKELPKRVKADY